jgi:Holliday junction resolvase RusA-like endonuclease
MGYGKARDTHKNRKAKKFIAKCVNERVEEVGWDTPFTGAVVMVVEFLFKKPKSSKLDYPTHLKDIDNICKTLMDGVTRANGLKGENGDVVWHDDGCVIDVVLRKRWTDGDGETKVTLMEVEK